MYSKQSMPQLLFSNSIVWIVRRQKAIENVPVPSYHSSINTIMIASSHPRCSTQCMTAIGPIMVGIFLSLKKLNWERSSETAIHSRISYLKQNNSSQLMNPLETVRHSGESLGCKTKKINHRIEEKEYKVETYSSCLAQEPVVWPKAVVWHMSPLVWMHTHNS